MPDLTSLAKAICGQHPGTIPRIPCGPRVERIAIPVELLPELNQAVKEVRPTRQEQLLDEAAKQLNARGVNDTSLTELAETLGLTRAALYHYVCNREDLVFQCYRRSCFVMLAHLRSVDEVRDPKDRLAAFIERALEETAPEFASFSEIGLLGSAERLEVLDTYGSLVARIGDLIAAGIAAGQFRRCDKRVAARSIVSLMFWPALAPRWSAPIPPPPRSQLIAALKNVLFSGFATVTAKVEAPPVIDLSPLGQQPHDAFDRVAIAAAKREKILATASRMFNLRGIQATSLDDIAAAFGATKRTLYHFVGNKQALMTACFRRAYDMFVFAATSAAALSCSGIEALAAYYRAGFIIQIRSDLAPLRPLAGYDTIDAESRAVIDGGTLELLTAYRSIVAKGKADGSIRDIDLDQANLVTPGISIWLVKGLHDDLDLGPEVIAMEMANLICLGLSARR
jgi:AcrR family transcriptional regulator